MIYLLQRVHGDHDSAAVMGCGRGAFLSVWMLEWYSHSSGGPCLLRAAWRGVCVLRCPKCHPLPGATSQGCPCYDCHLLGLQPQAGLEVQCLEVGGL